MDFKDYYLKAGGDYEDALERLISERFIERFAMKLIDDKTYPQLLEAVAAGDIDESFRLAHTLKGVAANVGFTNLFNAASNLTEQLRPRTEQADPALIEKVTEVYSGIVGILNEYKNQ